VQPWQGERQVPAPSSQCRPPMSHDDRDLNQGATIIPLARPEAGHAGQNSAKPPRLLDRVRAGLHARHYSRRTEKVYAPSVVAKARKIAERSCRAHSLRHYVPTWRP
jgi:hypothetical protein